MRIGIDIMGSDRPPQILLDAVFQTARQLPPSTHLLIIAGADYLKDYESQRNSTDCNIQFCKAGESIEMKDDPLSSLRSKKHSSLVTGLKLLKKNAIQAFVTAGNTGALIAGSRLILPSLPQIQRPALLALLPTQTGKVAVIDVGGNVSCKVQNLIQFAEMGAAFMQCSENIANPRIGLLNIGIESKKGTAAVQQAYQLLSEKSKNSFSFSGNIEGRDVFKGIVDVLVTDGFTGNVLLKTSEGVAHLILDYLKKKLQLTNALAIKEIQSQFNYSEYPGAIVLGVDGIVIKCHGDASPKAMHQSIKMAYNLLEKRLINKIKASLSEN